MILPPPALRHLAYRKLRGALRKQLRRVRTPSGALFAVVGGLVIGLWFLSIALSVGARGRAVPAPEDVRAMVKGAGLFLSLLTLTGSLNYRGLYMPREEIEPLFSAPVKRSDLVRYRLFVNTGRSLFASVIFGFLILSRIAHPVYGFVGVFLAMQTLGVVGQLVAIVSGRLEKRFVERFARGPATLLVVVAVGGGAVLFVMFAQDGGGSFGRWLGGGRLRGLLEHPLVAAATLPFEPWARAMASDSALQFAGWSAVCVAVWLALVELTARLPIDFRELSLETSAHVAERIRRHRRSGGGASAGRVSRRTIGWRVPWLFGRGPAGAIAWRKLVSIVRKLGGTFVISVLVLVFLTLLASTMFDEPGAAHALGGSVLIAGLGTVYLGGGLRFDFREELDLMERVKTWPVPSGRVFAAVLLPQVLLIALLLEAALLLRAVLTGSFHPALLVVVAGLPLVVGGWVAIDNVVFLFAPVRFVPGQEGTLQNAGRAMVMVFVRVVLVSVPGALLGAALWGVWALVTHLGGGAGTAAGATAVAAVLVLLPADLALIALGGYALRRFDVARDRG